MANVQLAVMCVALWAILPCGARDCLTHCCDTTEIKQAGHHLTSRVERLQITPTPQDYKPSSDGPVSQRSTSPWTYEVDEDGNRFPTRLWQARCNHPRCISLHSSSAACQARTKIDHLGNSVIVDYVTVVFFRRQCKGEPDRFRLVPEPYRVNVSCTCVVRNTSC
ncbi:UNVERIFIED_CONTAM: hypothetical protein K2H54_043264 [Gekko kuhli]